MPHQVDLVLTLTVAMTAAVLLGFVAHWLKLPPLVGYLGAGILIGPHTPGFVADHRVAEQLAEIGVVLLMFGVGLHFHLEDLMAARRVAMTGAISEMAAMTGLGSLTGHMFGFSWPASIVFGISLSVASTVVLTRVLADNNQLKSPIGKTTIGWLVVEDLATVFVLVILPSVAVGEGGPMALVMAVGLAILKLALLSAFVLGPGGHLIPRALSRAAGTHSRELFTLTVLVIALGVAVTSEKIFGVSLALGAFLAGMVVGRSKFGTRAATEASVLRDAFAALFFVSVGMLLNPEHLVKHPVQVLLTIALVLIAKPVAAFIILSLLRQGFAKSLQVAVALAQIGEFSFMVAAVGHDLGLLPPGARESLIAASIASIILNPMLFRLVPKFTR